MAGGMTFTNMGESQPFMDAGLAIACILSAMAAAAGEPLGAHQVPLLNQLLSLSAQGCRDPDRSASLSRPIDDGLEHW